MTTCYAIVQDDYEEEVIAIFTTKEMAEAEIANYRSDFNPCRIEEFPLNPVAPRAPYGMHGYKCSTGADGTFDAKLVSPVQMHKDAVKIGQVRRMCFSWFNTYDVYLWARDKDHALELAAEMIAKHRAADRKAICRAYQSS